MPDGGDLAPVCEFLPLGVIVVPGIEWAEHGWPKRPYWDREWLTQQYTIRQRSAADIAAEFGRSASAVNIWRRRFGLSKHPKDNSAFLTAGRLHQFRVGTTCAPPQPYWNKEWLQEQLVIVGAVNEIAAACGVNAGAIYSWVRRHGLSLPRPRQMPTKQCRRCQRALSLEEFRTRNKRRPDGSFVTYLNATCTECDRALASAYREAHKDQVRERNRLSERKRYARLSVEDRSRYRIIAINRRARLAKGPGLKQDDVTRIVAGQQGRCWWCGKKIKAGELHLDHRIPLARGGEHSPSNIVASCARCNSSKHTKMPWEFAGRLL